MKKEILHKNDLVISIDIDKRGFIEKIYEIPRPELLPCVFSKDESDLKIGLQMWLLNRQLGRTRQDIIPVKSFYGPEIFQSKNMVSLYDCYWIRDNEKETWESVSPFQNWDYEEDCYFDLLHDPENTFDVDNMSPNLTLPGNDPKFWYQYESKIGIITESSQEDMKIYKKAKELGLEKIVSPRSYVILNGTIYSFHPSGTSEQVERFPFDVLYDSVAKEDVKKIENLKNCCETYGLEDWREFMGSVMKLDSELGNKERNLCEIGVLRDTESLKILGFEKV